MDTRTILGAVAALTTVGATLAIDIYPQTVRAQTQGVERRGERRDTRQDSRDVKQACKAGDEKSRAECRQTKRDVKQTGRQDGTTHDAAPAPKATTQPAP
jgi:hypothetical protein